MTQREFKQALAIATNRNATIRHQQARAEARLERARRALFATDGRDSDALHAAGREALAAVAVCEEWGVPLRLERA